MPLASLNESSRCRTSVKGAPAVKSRGVFQGGGAKGYAHVGALRAAQDRGIEFVQLAGTSIGAIVATLTAAGYEANELLNPNKPLGARGVLDLDPATILDPNEYSRATALLEQLARFKGTNDDDRRSFRGSWNRFKGQTDWVVALRLAKLMAANCTIRKAIRTKQGLVDLRPAVEWLDGLLREKLQLTRPIVFGDLRIPTKVVTADIRTRKLVVQGGPDGLSSEVAPAVMASACFPFFFQPLAVGSGLYLDGGLVSNLPAWIFDQEQTADPSFVPTFGFRLRNRALIDSASLQAPTTFTAFLGGLLETLQSGASSLQERQIDDYHGIDLDAAVETLAFDQAREKAPNLVRSGSASVDTYFKNNIGPRDPRQMRNVLSIITRAAGRRASWTGKLRAAVLLPESNGQTARTTYSYLADDDGDDRLRVRIDGVGAGAVFSRKEPIHYDLTRLRAHPGGLDKYELAARPAGQAFMYVIPVFDDQSAWSIDTPLQRPTPIAALVLDSSESFGSALSDTAIQDDLVAYANVVIEEARSRRYVSTEQEITTQPSVGGWSPIGLGPNLIASNRKLRNPAPGAQILELSRALSSLRQ